MSEVYCFPFIYVSNANSDQLNLYLLTSCWNQDNEMRMVYTSKLCIQCHLSSKWEMWSDVTFEPDFDCPIFIMQSHFFLALQTYSIFPFSSQIKANISAEHPWPNKGNVLNNVWDNVCFPDKNQCVCLKASNTFSRKVIRMQVKHSLHTNASKILKSAQNR